MSECTCVISQPRLFPGLHYLQRMMLADVFVILDTAQFNPRHEENRAKIKTPQGGQWLTVPMRQRSRAQRITDTAIDNTQPWRRKVWGSIQNHYARAPGFAAHAAAIQAIVDTPHETLTSLDVASWQPALEMLGVTCRFVRASELPVTGTGPQYLLDVCKHLGATRYLSGAFGREYLDVSEFAREGIDVAFHDFQHPTYPQRYEAFVPFLSYLDALFNNSLTRELVASGASEVIPGVEVPS